MESERNAGTLSEDDVLELETEVEPALGRPASAGVEVAIGRIKKEWIVGSVELDVFAAQPHSSRRISVTSARKLSRVG
jgi:hypothetical protein